MNRAPQISILLVGVLLLAGLTGLASLTGLAGLANAQAPNVAAELVPAEDAETATNAMILIGAPQGSPLEGEALEKVTVEVGSRLRCPVCQGLSVADSHTDTAVGMMDEARDLLAAGFTPEQTLLYFEQSYGEFIRLEPKAEGFNLVVWIVPVLALLLGLGVIAARLRATRASSASSASAPEGDDPELAEYLAQVRREVTDVEEPDVDEEEEADVEEADVEEADEE